MLMKPCLQTGSYILREFFCLFFIEFPRSTSGLHQSRRNLRSIKGLDAAVALHEMLRHDGHKFNSLKLIALRNAPRRLPLIFEKRHRTRRKPTTGEMEKIDSSDRTMLWTIKPEAGGVKRRQSRCRRFPPKFFSVKSILPKPNSSLTATSRFPVTLRVNPVTRKHFPRDFPDTPKQNGRPQNPSFRRPAA